MAENRGRFRSRFRAGLEVSFILCAGVFGFGTATRRSVSVQLIWHGHTLRWWSLPGVEAGGKGREDGGSQEMNSTTSSPVSDTGDEVVEFSSQGM